MIDVNNCEEINSDWGLLKSDHLSLSFVALGDYSDLNLEKSRLGDGIIASIPLLPLFILGVFTLTLSSCVLLRRVSCLAC